MSEFVTITPELMAGFLDEAPEYLSMLDDGLLAFEGKAGTGTISLEDPEDQERMTVMFRAAHSLKGLAAVMGFDKIRDLTHLMETLFDRVRMGKNALDPTTIQTLFGVFDRLRELVGELSNPVDEPIIIEDALETLEKILNATDTDANESAGSTPAQDEPAQNVSPAAQTPPATENPPGEPNVFPDDPDLMQRFIESTVETIEEFNQQLLKLEEAPNDLEIINAIFRCAHNIKGASGAVGCNTLFRLTHDMESVLDQLRAGQRKLDETLVNALFGAVDRLRSDLELIRQGRPDELTYDGIASAFDKWLEPGPEDQTQAGGQDAAGTESSADTPAGHPDVDGVLLLTATFPPDFAEAEIQAYLIHNRLSEFGNILSSDPDVDSLDGGSALERITFYLQTDEDPDEIKSVISKFKAQSITVRTQGAPETESNAQAPTSANTPTASAESKPEPTVVTPMETPPKSPAKPAPKASNAPVPTKKAGPKRPVAKVGETLRVDLERLDQLMNLGGELVINKARFNQIERSFLPLFSGENVGYLVDDMTERIARLRDAIARLQPSPQNARITRDIAETALHLAGDFESVRQLVDRVHESRGTMNDFSEAVHSLTRVSEGIQKRIMQTRMVSIGPLFQRFRRVVRDIAKSSGKNVELELHGETTELDKRMIDELGDPLTHMIRNSVDHGIEMPDVRAAAGKPKTAKVILEAYHRGRHINIEVRDDGKGIDVDCVREKIIERELATPAQVEQMPDKEIIQYVFRPGFSTAKVVTDLSGRGMGMDIVVNKIENINGTVELDSTPGKGTVATIKLPLTLAIIRALIARIGKGIYALPLEMVAEIITVPQSGIQFVQRRRVVQVRDRVIPIALFEQVFQTDRPELQTATRDNPEVTLVILGVQDDRFGLIVDEMIGQEDVVIKSIATNYQNVTGIAGASIMGDGSVSLILDVGAMLSMFAQRSDCPPADLTAPAHLEVPSSPTAPTHQADSVRNEPTPEPVSIG